MSAPTASEHREAALGLLEASARYAPNSPARLAALAEAQLHATLALSAPAEILVPEAVAAAPKRRPRKTAATTEEAAK
ncbi:hypothetical protein SEA_SNEK_52 [Arthrobacter phage Snek]